MDGVDQHEERDDDGAPGDPGCARAHGGAPEIEGRTQVRDEKHTPYHDAWESQGDTDFGDSGPRFVPEEAGDRAGDVCTGAEPGEDVRHASRPVRQHPSSVARQLVIAAPGASLALRVPLVLPTRPHQPTLPQPTQPGIYRPRRQTCSFDDVESVCVPVTDGREDLERCNTEGPWHAGLPCD